jgi:hypothetical protein
MRLSHLACPLQSVLIISFAVSPGEAGRTGLRLILAVELICQNIIPFAAYSEYKSDIRVKMDLLVTKPKKIAVEIKVNYWGDDEITKHCKKTKPLPDRAVEDIKKLKQLGSNIHKVFLISTVFESADGLKTYKNKIFDKNQKVIKDLNWKWYDCSASPSKGYNLLLVVSDILRLPEISRLTS